MWTAMEQIDSVCREFKKLSERCGVKLPGGPYLLRKTYRTIANATIDSVKHYLSVTEADFERAVK